MPKIRHVAVASSQREKLAEFYKRAFGMKEVKGEGGAIYLSNGKINLALNEQYAGREAGLYHFGFEVEDLDALKKKLKDAGAGSEVQRRPRNREAEYRVLDPDGNPIDLTDGQLSSEHSARLNRIRGRENSHAEDPPFSNCKSGPGASRKVLHNGVRYEGHLWPPKEYSSVGWRF